MDAPSAIPSSDGIDEYNKLYYRARTEAEVRAKDARIGEPSDLVVRDLLPSDFGWGTSWRQEEQVAGTWNTTHEGREVDAIVLVFGLSVLRRNDPVVREVRLHDAIGERKTHENVEGKLLHPGLVGVPEYPPVFKRYMPEVQQRGPVGGDARLMLHGVVAERIGSTVAPG